MSSSRIRNYNAGFLSDIGNLYSQMSNGEYGIGNFGSILSDWWNSHDNWNDSTATLYDSAVNAMNLMEQERYNTEMSNTQYQRGVADMRAAGVNPALVYGQGKQTTTSPTASPAPIHSTQTNSAAARFSAIAGGINGLLDIVQKFAMLSSNLDVNSSVAAFNRANAGLVREQTINQQNVNTTFWEKYEVELETMFENKDKISAETFLARQKAGETIANQRVLYKQLGVMDMQITKGEAETALLQAEAFHQWLLNTADKDTLHEYKRLINEYQIASTEREKAVASKTLAEQVEIDFHNNQRAINGYATGDSPGVGGAVLDLCTTVVTLLDGGVSQISAAISRAINR